MDFLSKLQSVEDADSYDFIVRDPSTNSPLMALVLAGPTHPNMIAHKKRQDRNLSQLVKRNRDIGKAITTSVTEGLDDEDVALAREMDRLTAATLGWKDVGDDGMPKPTDTVFDAKLMEQMYRAKLWLRNLVSSELNRTENFTKNSANN